MQRKLFAIEERSGGSGRYVKDYLCPECVLDPNNVPENVQARYARGKLRPILEGVTHTILRCPVCGVQYLTKEFYS